MSTLITDKVDNAAVQKEKLDTSAYLPHTPWLQFLLVCCLFALWGMAGNLNDILIAQFKKGFDLTDTQTALVQSIFFLGYFFVALPAAALIKRFSYKAAIIIGLCLYALGCFLFVPAAQIMTYGAFLACLGVIACGLSFLETSANTYFGLVIKGMGKDTQTAGSIVVMSIIGGAVIPLVMGIISDMNGGNMQIAFIAPLLCFVYVAFYGFWCVRKGV